MIVVRDVFRLKYGAAKPALAAMKEGRQMLPAAKAVRVLTDLIGTSYTVVLETTFASMSECESEMHKVMGNPAWGKWYHEKFVPHVESGYREVFNIVE
jgi:hypothetical protein